MVCMRYVSRPTRRLITPVHLFAQPQLWSECFTSGETRSTNGDEEYADNEKGPFNKRDHPFD